MSQGPRQPSRRRPHAILRMGRLLNRIEARDQSLRKTHAQVLLVSPSHELAGRRHVTMSELSGNPVVAHNDPSPARERVLRLFEEHHISLNMVIALPSLDGIKRAVELNLGVALLPRRCAITEIANKRLVAVQVTGVSRKRQVMLVCRKVHRSHAADAFLKVAQEHSANI